MLSIQAKTTLIAYGILMISFLIPLKGDKTLSKKIALFVLMLIPISLAVYTVNCLVTGSKGKYGLGCNTLAWINSLCILLTVILILLSNMSKKKKLEEKFNNEINENNIELVQIAGGSKGMGQLDNVEANSFKDNNSNYSPMNLFNNTLSRHQNGWLTNNSHPLSTKPALLKFTFNDRVKIIKMILFPRSPSLISNFLKDYKLYGTNNENDINIQDSILEKKSSTLNLLLEVENETKPESKYHFGTDPNNKKKINGRIPNPVLVAQDQIDDNNRFILHKLITNPGIYKYYILEITKVRADNEQAASLSEIVFYKGAL